jgi:hypothetical protein
MRFALVCWFLLVIGAMAQQPSPRITVRSIRVRPISTNRTPLVDISMDAFAAALKSRGINLTVESKFDPPAIDKAAEVLRGMYRDAGQEVRVEHTASEIPPHSAEVSFEVIQLCTCH